MHMFFSSIALLLTLDGASHYFSPKGNQTAEVLIAVINLSSRRTGQAREEWKMDAECEHQLQTSASVPG